MNNLHFLLCATLLAFVSSAIVPAQAQSVSEEFACTGAVLESSQGEDVVRKVQAAYQKVNSLQAEFLQESYLAALDASEASSGEMFFRRPGQMRWNYQKPEVQVFLLRDNTLLLYQEREHQVLRQSFSDVFLTDLPAAFILGVGDLTKDLHLLKACRGRLGMVLELAPVKARRAESAETADKDLKTLKLLIDSKSFLPLGAKVNDVGGNHTAIRFVGPRINQTLAGQIFEFEVPKGSDVMERASSNQSSSSIFTYSSSGSRPSLRWKCWGDGIRGGPFALNISNLRPSSTT